MFTHVNPTRRFTMSMHSIRWMKAYLECLFEGRDVITYTPSLFYLTESNRPGRRSSGLHPDQLVLLFQSE